VQDSVRVFCEENPVDHQKCYVCPRLIAIQSARIILKVQISGPHPPAFQSPQNNRLCCILSILGRNQPFSEVTTVRWLRSEIHRASRYVDNPVRPARGRRRLQTVVIRTTIDRLSGSVFVPCRWNSDLKVQRWFPNRFRYRPSSALPPD
jgi:hypothetical protein